MADYEKLGVFYLGRPVDPTIKKAQPGLLLYDSKDLVTHAVCVGMTGSGKTGLCISLLEEAAMDGIPAIAIDPKGDLTNLLLTFPDLKPQDFSPWINEDEARNKGLSKEDYAVKQAELWKNGLLSWDQTGDRIARLRQAAEFVIYTPGSTAGIPVSILKSFSAPPTSIIDDDELFRERIGTTVTSLLGIMGVEGDPMRSREHILISTLLERAWRKGQDVDIATLIRQIQTPPITKIGIMDIDSFFPAKERFGLSLALNNLLAAPGFNNWLEGEPLEIDSILYNPGGKPRIALFSIAHLNDSERMFFVSLLLNQFLGWMRTQSGTSSLRAIVYMDEIFGFFPPVATPPSKAPMLTLLKQARAFGVGIVLATQNPVDLDYKGLANTGTWFIGRLQTERDKARVMEGLEGVAASSGVTWDRHIMEQTLAGLSNRVFLMNNVHDDAPTVFETRWAMSYLRGPLTRTQIKTLMDPIRNRFGFLSAVAATSKSQSQSDRCIENGEVGKQASQPILPPKIKQYFIHFKGLRKPERGIVYKPQIIGAAEIHFSDVKSGVNIVQNVLYGASPTDGPISIDWDQSSEISINPEDLEQSPAQNAQFEDLPLIATKPESYGFWAKEFAGWLCRSQKLELWKSPSLKEYSKVGETERDFRVRLQVRSREQRDAAVIKLREKYSSRLAMAKEQMSRAQIAVEREKEQAKQQQIQTALSFGNTLLSGFLGKKISSGSISRAKTTMSGVSRTMKESKDIDMAQENVAAIQQKLNQIEADFKNETEAISAKLDPLTEQFERLSIFPLKTGVNVQILSLGWVPHECL
jgi:hypothetical protein